MLALTESKKAGAGGGSYSYLPLSRWEMEWREHPQFDSICYRVWDKAAENKIKFPGLEDGLEQDAPHFAIPPKRLCDTR